MPLNIDSIVDMLQLSGQSLRMNEAKSETRALLITGLLAILGTVAGGVVSGQVNANLAAQKFQSDLIIKALEPSDEANRISNLSFLLNAGLISNIELRQGLSAVLKDPARSIPQFQTPLQVVSTSRGRRLGGDTSRYTDIEVFVCNAKKDDPIAGKLFSGVIARLSSSDRIGKIIPGVIENSSSYNSFSVPGKTIVVVDAGHPEIEDARRIVALIQDIPGIAPLEIQHTSLSKKSYWQLQVIICPS